jgi:hypothetical protein
MQRKSPSVGRQILDTRKIIVTASTMPTTVEMSSMGVITSIRTRPRWQRMLSIPARCTRMCARKARANAVSEECS